MPTPHKILEFLKTFFLLLLIACMIVLVVLNMSETQQGKWFSGREIEFNKLWITQSEQPHKTDTFDSAQITPAFIGIRLGGGTPRGIFSGTGFIRDFFRLISAAVGRSFGANATVDVLSAEDGGLLWDSTAQGENYVFVKFHLQLPSSVICAHATAGSEVALLGSPGYNSAPVFEMFILLEPTDKGDNLPEDFFAYTIITRSVDGTVARFVPPRAPGRDADANFMLEASSLEAYYYNSRMREFAFAGGIPDISGSSDDSNGAGISSTLPVFDGLTEIRQQIEFDPAASLICGEDGTLPAQLVTLLNFNPDKLGDYSKPDSGSVLYVETHGTIRASAYSLQYTALPGGGIDCSDYLSYQKDAGQYDIFDAIRAGESFVNAVKHEERDILGGTTGYPGLTQLYYTDETLVMEYSYFCDNIKIENKYSTSTQADVIPESLPVTAFTGGDPDLLPGVPGAENQITEPRTDGRSDLPAVRLEITGEKITSVEINSRAVILSEESESVVLQPQYWLLKIASLPESRFGRIRDMQVYYAAPLDETNPPEPNWKILY